MKRLSTPSGGVVDSSPKDSDNDGEIVRSAILVHAGPNGETMRFQSGDGPIDFDEARIKRVVMNQNKLLTTLAEGYGGVDKMPAGAWTPIIDQHSDSSSDSVRGRYASLLRFEVRDVPGVGKNVPCAVADLRFLGKDTVERVKDGRIYHLSIGIDEKTDTLGETSTVIEPAAPGAMLLNRGDGRIKLPKGKKKMSDKLKRMKAHSERMAKLSAMKAEFTKSSTKLAAAKELVRMEKRQNSVTHRLAGVMKAGKMTPAEYKKLDVKKLAKLDDESLSVALSAFEARETPVVHVGQRGSTDAAAFSDMGKSLEEKQWKRMKKEAIKDIKRMSDGKVKMKSDEDESFDKKMSGPLEEEINPGKDEHVVPGQAGEKELAEAHKALKACLEAGDVDGAKAHHEKIMAIHADGKTDMSHLEIGDVKSEESEKNSDDMQKQMDEMSTQLARMSGMVDELMGAEKEEGHELEAADDEEEEPKPAKAE